MWIVDEQLTGYTELETSNHWMLNCSLIEIPDLEYIEEMQNVEPWEKQIYGRLQLSSPERRVTMSVTTITLYSVAPFFFLESESAIVHFAHY